MDNLTPRVKAWMERGHNENFRGHNIHCFHQEGASETGRRGRQEMLVICHGYPTCSYDWVKVLDQGCLRDREVLIFDFLGFGLSDKPTTHAYTLAWQADLLEELVRRHLGEEEGKREVILIGHDMGTSVVSELIARDLEGSINLGFKLVGAFLFNGSMLMERANLILGQKLLRSRLGPVAAKLTFSLPFKWQLGSVFSRAHPLSREEGEDQWALMSWKSGHRINDKLIQYTFERVEKADRWLGAVREWRKPIAFAWGKEDPVCGEWQLDGWKELRPTAPLFEMKGLGHYPQIEDPEGFARALVSGLEYIEGWEEKKENN